MRLRNISIFVAAIVLLLGFAATAQALTYTLPKPGGSVVGKVKLAQVGFNNAAELALKYDVGHYELMEANPLLNLKDLSYSDKLVVPTRFILPAQGRRGIIVNLAEMRMYFYPPHSNTVLTFPVGIGKKGWPTPIAQGHITAMAMYPSWKPTKAVRADFLKLNGYPLPELVGPGPDNPLGDYAIRLSIPTIFIHGNNNPLGVGGRVSAGCMRMFNKDVGQIYSLAHVGTKVNIIYQPYKAGWQGNTLYFEAHLKIPGRPKRSYQHVIRMALKDRPHANIKINWQHVRQMVKMGLGIPQPIATIKS